MSRNSNKAAVRWLFAHTKGKRRELAAIAVCNAVFAASGTAFALFCRGVIDSAVSGDSGQILLYAALLAGIVALQLVLKLVCNSLAEKVAAKLEMRMRQESLGRLLSAELSETSKYHSGELLNRMFSDVRICADGVVEIVPSAVNLVTQLVCAAAVMLALEPRFAGLFLAAGAVLFVVTKLLRGRLKGLHKQVQEKEGAVRSFMQEAVESTAVIKVFGAEERVLQKNDGNQREHYKIRMKRRRFGILAGAGFGLVFQAGYVAALVWGAFGIFSGTMSYGTLTAVLQLVNQIQSPFAGLSSLFPRYYAAAASAERLMELEALPEEKAAERELAYADLERITVSGVRFSYGRNDVITRADFSINKGDTVALTGVSGGGKTTLFMLLLGAYSPSDGRIEFKGKGGVFPAGRATRGCFAYVPQGNCLFSGTIRENIAFLEKAPDEAKIVEAAKAACAWDFISELPQGLDTPLGEDGAGLSEGQAQRIAAARAVYSGAGILLLDEATSALDEATESQLLSNIAHMSGKTVLIVTHRPAALEICSKRLILDNGEIRNE